MNKSAYERLPRDLKAVIDNNSGQMAASMAGAMWDLEAAAVADMVVQRGDSIVTLLPEAVEHWRKATEPVVDAWQKQMKEHKIDGGKLLANAQALLEQYANEPEPQPPPRPQPEQPPRPGQQIAARPAQPPQAKTDVTPTNTNAPVPAPAAVAKPAPAVAPLKDLDIPL
jgi:extracellular solute-binding protein (family 7)